MKTVSETCLCTRKFPLRLEVIRIPDQDSGFGPDSPWQMSALSECSRVMLRFVNKKTKLYRTAATGVARGVGGVGVQMHP